MCKAKLRPLLCQIGELNERELDALFDAVQKCHRLRKPCGSSRTPEDHCPALIGGVPARHLPRYRAWMRTFAGYQDKPRSEIYRISVLGKQLINTF